MTVVDYASKFEDQSRFCPHYNRVEAKGSYCVKFKSGLHPETKLFISYQEIRRFLVLVNKCRFYDEDIRGGFAQYKSVSEKKSECQHRAKPYVTLVAKGNQKFQQKAVEGSGSSGGGVSTSLRCFKCGELVHYVAECKSIYLKCFKCGEQGHRASE
ncbi:uncharacterized protein LOC127115327 [Lathyrus oleraceus]|uniref:uncharacterized protein LOC127115327 n=1 Tax=Pisum sativum TaxID=3888 RepID=UPI0021D3EAD7|nr:uncharacterized protein LOC127115327 [Pisum sativum]